MNGRVRIWRHEKFNGHIEGEDGVKYFFHIEDVVSRETLKRGAAVTFTPTQGARGLRATAVQRRLQPSAPAPQPTAVEPER